jgi:Protein of unknown function (DUF4246)
MKQSSPPHQKEARSNRCCSSLSTTKEKLTMDSPDKRPPKISRIGDDDAQYAATGEIVSNEGPVVGSTSTSTGSPKTDSTMLPLPIASRIASFNVASTSQLARLRCVSRPFYRSLLDHTTSAGSTKHFIQCPASAKTQSLVYNFINELTVEQPSWNTYFENGDVIRRRSGEGWDSIFVEGSTIEKLCLMKDEDEEPPQNPPLEPTTPLSIEKVFEACDALGSVHSYDQFRIVTRMIMSDGLLQPVVMATGDDKASSEKEEEEADLVVFGAFITILVAPDVAQQKVRSFNGRQWLELETTKPDTESNDGQLIRPRRPNCSYIAPVISHDDEGWKAVVLVEVAMNEEKSYDLLEECTVESLRLKSAWDKAQNNTNLVEGIVIVDDFFAGRESLCAKIDALAKLQEATSSVDFHPNTNNVVRNIVHPALFCYVAEVTTLKRSVSEAPPCTLSPENPLVTIGDNADFWGRPYEDSVYQWLPTYFDVAVNGSCTIEDYINNLVPRDNAIKSDLYRDLEKLFQSCLPFIESVYSYVRAIRPLIRDDTYLDYKSALPEPFDVKYCSLRGQKLQVITKIVDYELFREQTHTGVWHVEGMSHEEIVLTALYIADRDDEFCGADIDFKRTYLRPEAEYLYSNVSQSRLPAAEEMIRVGLIPLGKVSTPKGRLVVFPNSHVHKVTDMSFLPKSEHNKSVKRRIVVFFLVNPFTRTVSTREVAPQQMACGGKMTLEDALAHRLQLMHERRHSKQDWNVREIELCEH